MNTVGGGFLVLTAVGFGCACLACGLANTIDWFCYKGHRLARNLRELHGRQTASMNELWVRELER